MTWTCPSCSTTYPATEPVRHVCPPIKRGGKPITKPVRPKIDTSDCVHRGTMIETITCRGCGGEKQVDVYECGVHDRCHTVPANDHRAGMSCTACAMADEGFSLIPAADAGTDADAAAAQTAAPPQGPVGS